MAARKSFASDITEAAAGEPIEAVVIGEFGGGDGWGYDDSDSDKKNVPAAMRGPVLAWEEARPLLDYAYDDGFGAQGCHNFYAWTATRVLFVHEYDGSTYVTEVPRHPTDGEMG